MALQLSESNQAKLRALREALDALRLEGGYQSLLSTAHAGADTTGSQGSKDVSALVNRIDEEIAILRVHVAQVHRQIANHCQTRNQLSPIHRLPPEVLLDILQTATLSDYDVDIQLRNQLSLEQVCSHWRKLMDSVPRIFGGASHSRNARVVSETGDLPIHVVVGRYNGKFLDFSERHIHRWASLRLDKSVPEDWLKHFRSAAPLLRSLNVKLCIYMRRWPKTPNPFDGKAPQLRHLKMLYAPLPWNSSLIHGLQSLHFTLDLDPEEHVHYGLKLRHVLQSCPQLEDLALSGPYSQRDRDPSLVRQKSNDIIHLPHLRKLMLWKAQQSHVVRWFLDTVRAPSLESLSIGAEFIDVAELTATFEGPAVDGVLSMSSGALPLHMTLGDSAGKWIEVWSKEGYRNGQVALGVQWEISDTSTFEGSPIDFLATTIPFWTHQIRILELRDGIRYKFPEQYGDTIGGFLVELVELERLIVNHDTMKATSIITILGSPI
ncbi:hypothetical protein FRC02_006693, partial [Tulasnella sp. 418]